MKVICIICARGGSKGLPNKNLRKLDGESLIARAVRHAKESKACDVILVSTDSADIAQEAIKAGAEVPFLRPSSISGDLATTEETLKHALLQYESLKNTKFDIGVFITPTDIFRKVEWINEVVNRLINNSKFESVFVGYKTHKNFWEKDEAGNWSRLREWMSVYSSRQIRRSVIREDTGLACASRASLWRAGRRIGDFVDVLEVADDFTGIDIHRYEDLRLAESAIQIRKDSIDAK